MAWWLCACGLFAPGVVHASDRPLLVVVEAAPQDAARIRDGIAEALSRPVVSLLDAGARWTAESVSVGISRDGRTARVCYRDQTGARFRDVTAPDGAGDSSWIAHGVVALVREASAMAWSSPPEILDPFVEDSERSLGPSEAPTDILDPWQPPPARPRAPELGGALGRPRPR